MKDTMIVSQRQPTTLFQSWSELSDERKAHIMNRLDTENDPFRQDLLDTFLCMDTQEIMKAFDDGIQGNHWRFMSLAVQAMSKDYVKGLIDTSYLAMALDLAFENSLDTDSQVWRLRLSDIYPYYYAVQKIRIGRSDCAQEAIAAAEKAYGLTSPPIMHTFDHMAIYAGILLTLLEEGRDGIALETILKSAFMTEQDSYIPRRNIDSFFHGFDAWRGHDRILDMGASMMAGDRLEDALAERFLNKSFSDEDMGFVLLLTEMAGADNVIGKIEKGMLERGYRNWRYLTNNLVNSFSINEFTCDDLDNIRGATNALAQMYVRQSKMLTVGNDSGKYAYESIDTSCKFLDQFTSKESLLRLFDQAFDEVQECRTAAAPYQFKKGNPDTFSLSDKVNLVTIMADFSDVDPGWKTGVTMSKMAVRCLALSGSSHPEFLSGLSDVARVHIMNKMTELRVHPDPRVLLKCGLIKKDRALEIGLGL